MLHCVTHCHERLIYAMEPLAFCGADQRRQRVMSKNNAILTADRVRFLLSYNPETGDLTWRNPASNNVYEGQRAGSFAGNGRCYVMIDGAPYLAHRIIWLHAHGSLPDGNVVPVNGDYADWRLVNLMAQSRSETAAKSRARTTNTSGVKGVSWDKTKNKWQATITRDYKQVHLGRFDTVEEAKAAYDDATYSAVPPDVMSDPDERRRYVANIARRSFLRRLWKQSVKAADGLVGWSSFEAFVLDVDSALSATQAGEYSRVVLAPLDTTQQIGPSNWQLCTVAAKLRRRTPGSKLAYERKHRSENRDVYKRKELMRDFGISMERYEAMLDAQNKLCAICEQPETAVRQGKTLTLAVDHCHKTGQIRDLLCGACNKGIGYFKDDPAIMEKAIAYLHRHQKPGAS